MLHAPEQYRYKEGLFQSSPADGNNGYFIVPFESQNLVIVCSDGRGWEHVSVSLRNRTPNWREMCHVKDLFWDKEDCVVQYHPPETEYVNNHENCLHMWRPVDIKIPLPPIELV